MFTRIKFYEYGFVPPASTLSQGWARRVLYTYLFPICLLFFFLRAALKINAQCSYYDRLRVLGYNSLAPSVALAKAITIQQMLESKGLGRSGEPSSFTDEGDQTEVRGLLVGARSWF